jgi:hypothetical protein
MVVLRDGKTTIAAKVLEESPERQGDTTTRGDQMEDQVAGLEAQLTEMRAMLQMLVGRSVKNTPSPVTPESAPLRAAEPKFQPTPALVPDFQSARGSLPQIPENGEPSFVQRPGKEPAVASAPVGAVGNQSRLKTAPIYGGNKSVLGQRETRSED